MSDAVLIEIVRAVPVIVSAALSLIAAMISFRTHQQVKDSRSEMNGRLSELVEARSDASRLEGNAEGRAELTRETNKAP